MRAREAVVFVGRKPTMRYVLACLTLFHRGFKEVTIKARGRAISKAADVVRIVKESFIRDVEIGGVEIGTEMVTGRDGRTFNVSAISIRLRREGIA